ncbi:MAG: hypothetical protein JJE10_09690 [Thermoleophilia bacterium]|jgi:hypothetical protein|nr:hypothetical protein [Thermoleophilia bacterium]
MNARGMMNATSAVSSTRRRIAVLLVAVSALAISSAFAVGTEAEGGPATVAAKKVTPKNGLYKGRTASDNPVTFRVKKGKVSRFSWVITGAGKNTNTGIVFPCKEDRGFIFTATPLKVNRKGRFSYGKPFSKYPRSAFKGKFVSRKRAKGSIYSYFTTPFCPFTNETTFTARRR